ncbi:MAG: FecCD family ABC transporter permease [Blastocatellia bacterium]
MDRAKPEKFEAAGYLTRRRALMVLIGLSLTLLVATISSLMIGSEDLGIVRILNGLQAGLTGRVTGLGSAEEIILFQIRAPRVALAIGVGAALALSGAAFQALLRNPLADPYVLGISGGAALGSMLAMILLPTLLPRLPFFSGFSGFSGQAIGGFLGAAAAMSIVYRLGRREDDPAHLVLAGVVMSTLISSFIVLLTALSDHLQLRKITLWLLGDLSSGTVEGASFLLLVVIIAGLGLMSQARALNLMMIGERDAFALGVETTTVRWIVYLLASILTAVAVTAGGAIGYVGLVVPHLIRLGAGADNRLVIPASAIGGALLVLTADAIARSAVAPRELPTGAITALIGAPAFLYLLIRGRR